VYGVDEFDRKLQGGYENRIGKIGNKKNAASEKKPLHL
jgi:hypothetical protein